MVTTRIPPIGLRESGRLLARILVALCLTLHGIGVCVPISTLANLTAEDTQEEAKSEVEVREVSDKGARVRFVSLRTERGFHTDLSKVETSSVAATLLPHPPCATHLVGAGIALRC